MLVESKPARLQSLDAFRGAVILLMVLVNNAGGPVSYAQLNHAEWHGWTLTDTVFPSFVWIVGVAITLSLGRRLQVGDTPAMLLPKIIRRSIIIYVLGLAIYVYPTLSLSHQRLLGVLQRIAICYLIASIIYLYTGLRSQIVWVLALFGIYWALMAFVDVPGYGPGNLDVERNFAHYVDRIVLGNHNYANTKTWDPEGIVSTLPAIGSALLGVLAGHLLTLPLGRARKWLLVMGCILIGLGLVWNMKLPINKKLWTDSFATFMAGLDCVALAVCIWVVDEHNLSKWVKPLIITGKNAIAVYLASEFLAEFLDGTHIHENLYVHYFQPLASPMNASLLWALSFTFLMFLLAWALYRRGWFLRV